jgi:uncharacterized protein YceK
MKGRKMILLLAVLALSGCGAMERHSAANNLQASDATYKECLAQAAGNVASCATQKAAYDTDVETYETLRGKRLRPLN